MAIVATLGLMAAIAMPAVAASVTPTPISNDNNPTCGDFGAWTELKSDPPGDGQVSDGTLTVTISSFVQSTSTTPGSFSWTSNIGVDAVLVKAGDDKHNLYIYDPESTGDTGLSPQAGSGNGISHISFCYDAGGASPTPTPTPTQAVATATPTPTPTPTGQVAGGTPTPRGAVLGSVPNTATSSAPAGSGPALALALLSLVSLGALAYVRLVESRTRH